MPLAEVVGIDLLAREKVGQQRLVEASNGRVQLGIFALGWKADKHVSRRLRQLLEKIVFAGHRVEQRIACGFVVVCATKAFYSR